MQHDNNNLDPAFLEGRLDTICEGFQEAIRREVEALRREGLPIYVAENGKVVDLQEQADPSG